MDYLTALFKHMHKRHRPNLDQMIAAKEEIGVGLLLQCFQMEDDSVTARARAIQDVCVSRFAPHVSDEQLGALVRKLNLPTEYSVRVLELVMSIRDLSTCRGEFLPASLKQ